MGLPETLKGVRLGGCRFTARGGEYFLTPNLASAHKVLRARCPGPPPPPPPPYNLDEGGGAPARGTHTQALNPKP